MIVKTTSNEALSDDQGAVSKVEGWNSMHILQYSSDEDVQAVFDSGLRTDHPYFNDERILEGFNVLEENANVNDTMGHGTHVTGIIYNNTLDNVKIKPYKLNYCSC